jgi:hypothetical protein
MRARALIDKVCLCVCDYLWLKAQVLEMLPLGPIISLTHVR